MLMMMMMMMMIRQGMFALLILIFPIISSGLVCLSNPCIHGLCVDEPDSQYSCYCIDGYTGVQCQTNWDECWSNPCQNGGICIDGIASFNCTCPPGFLGDFCEENYNECMSNPCQNNGSCIDATNGYICNCPLGFLGVHCEIDVAVCNTTVETRCANGGQCAEGPGLTFNCKCTKGWGGFLCDVELNECMSAPCQNGAICIDLHADYVCACRFGYSGKNCEEKVIFCDKSPCKNEALCLMEERHPVCYCVPDYHGEQCQLQYDECQLGPRCLNGGSCVDGIDSFSCSCPPNLTGLFCECLIISDEEIDCTYLRTTTTTTVIFPNLTTSASSIFTTGITKEEEFTMMTTTSTMMSSTFVPKSSDLTTIETSTIYLTTPESTSITTTVTPSTFFPSTIANNTEETTTVEETTIDEEITTKTLISTEISTETTTSMEKIETETTSVESTEVSSETKTEEETTTTTTTIATTVAMTTESPLSSEEYSTINLKTTTLRTTEGILETTSSVPPSTTSTVPPSTTSTVPPTTTSTVPPSTTDQTTSTVSFSTTEQTTTSTVSPSTTEQTTTSTVLPSTTSPVFETSSLGSTTFLTETPSLETESSLIPSLYTTIVTETTSSTTPEYTSTTVVYPNCDENKCQNGGTCLTGIKSFKCICPFNTEGILCEIRKKITTAAFGFNSYLIHNLINVSKVEVQFKAKTVSENGLLLHSTVDGTYMSLYIEKGFLQFKFSCGYQTMLLSELRNSFNNGFDTIIYARLEFDLELNRCYAVVKVNNTLTMSGDQIAIVTKLYKPSSLLYLGGVPDESVKMAPSTGFIGCMSDLKVSGKKMKIYENAQDGRQITECSSLVCLTNPCMNGGTCTSSRKGYNCNCTNGFLGKNCENSICDNNPCLYGGTCLIFPASGYICLCPYGKHGHFCENDIQISEPYFSPTINGFSSFSAYPIPFGSIQNNMELKFKFSPTTMEQISILMFIGQAGNHDVNSDHMAVSFVNGYILLTWNLGAGPRRIFTSKAIEKGKTDYLIQLGRMGRRSWLAVEGLGNVTGRSKENFTKLDVLPMLYLGGFFSHSFNTLPHDLPLHAGFSGCIFDVELKAGSVIIPLQSSRHAIGRAVGQCGITECHENSCQNGGICLHHASTFSCLCQEGWFGPLCSLKFNPCDEGLNNCSQNSICVPVENGYECDCPFGRTGNFCEINDTLTDISFSGKRSFLTLTNVEFLYDNFHFEFELRPLSDVGIVLYVGNGGKKFFSLALQSGFLELRTLQNHDTIEELIILRSKKLLAAGTWYKVRVGKFGRKLYISVENITNFMILTHHHNLESLWETIHFGGLPDLSELPTAAIAALPVPYTGCLRRLKLDSQTIDFNTNTVKISQNIQDCDGTPCGGDYCKNGGSCWLDSRLKPHCSCKNSFEGQRCTIRPKCHEGACKNGGQCTNSRCICTMGFTGAFCETVLRVTTPEFTGNSYIILKRIDKRRDLSNVEVKQLFINFTTVEKNGLIIWGYKKNNYLGIGLESGLLKLSFVTTNGSDITSELLDTDYLSDGIWHNLEVYSGKSKLDVKLDNKEVFSQKFGKAEFFNPLNGVFYLGGLPVDRNDTIWAKTRGTFRYYFKGCMRGFGLNKALKIADFSIYEGNNVGTCNTNI